MKKLVLLGTALVLTAVLLFSCNKNRFDFDHLESVNVAGQWNLPIASANISLEQLLNQFGADNLIQNDENGNLFVSFNDTIKEAFGAKMIWSLLADQHEFHLPYSMDNPLISLPGFDTLVIPYVETRNFPHDVKLNELNTDDTARVNIETLIIKSCFLSFDVDVNIGVVEKVMVSSPDIHKISDVNDTLCLIFEGSHGPEQSLADYVFDMKEYATSDEPCVRFNYGVTYEVLDLYANRFEFDFTLGFREIVIKELSAAVTNYVKDFAVDTAFSLPLGNISGAVSLEGVKVKVDQRSTFNGLSAKLQLDHAQMAGGNATPTEFFGGPLSFEIRSDGNYNNVIDQTLTLSYNSEFDKAHLDGFVDFNPGGTDHLIYIFDDSSIDVAYDVVVPFQFKVNNVAYRDTMDIALSEITAPEIVQAINLHVAVDSRLPIDLSAQIYTIDKDSGVITDSLLVTEELIKGKFDALSVNPNPVKSEFVVSVTQKRLEHFMHADKIIMRFNMDTENHTIWLNSGHALGVTLKLDVSYDGAINTDQLN